MRTTHLGTSDLLTTRLIYGCMRLPATWNPDEINDDREREAFEALDAAVEAGYRHFDHADIYAHGTCETIFGKYLRQHRRLRDQIVITTKCGIRFAGDPDDPSPQRYDFSPDWIMRSCEGSLGRLGIETLDVLLLHRPDVLMQPDEVAKAFDKLKSSGKVRHFGVSNFTREQTDLLQSRLEAPLVCNQIAVHPLRLDPIEDGTIDHLHRRRITPTAWSPLAGGRLGDEATSDDEQTAALLKTLDEEALAYGVTRAAMVAAWLLRHPSGILPIIGSRTPERITEAAAADGVELSHESWYRIYIAARGRPLP